jgi:hypothetical protein
MDYDVGCDIWANDYRVCYQKYPVLSKESATPQVIPFGGCSVFARPWALGYNKKIDFKNAFSAL